MSTAIHWFRRDLRITDNTALAAAASAHDSVVPVYIVSRWKKKHRWTGAPRQEFLCGCLASLAANLETKGGRLIIRHGDADKALEKLARETEAEAIYYNRDPDPFGRAMEERLGAVSQRLGIQLHESKDHALHERDETLTEKGEPYRVFTPYARAWAKLEKTSPGRAVSRLHTPRAIHSEPLPTLETWGLHSDAEVLKPGESAARRRLSQFLDDGIFSYSGLRDIPASEGTSRLSQDLRHGTLSIREIYSKCREVCRKATAAQRRSVEIFINELVWREFYFQALWHWPDLLEREFLPERRGMKWEWNEEALQRWQDGQTGFPIVDAGMRQLKTTGFMHNRVRMIVAMFLTKDLHLDWRAGEQWFMQRLVDGEIASNNGGWQWSASTGADAAPYFRIQNPWSQTKRYDPDGDYIRRWVPELRDTSAEKLMAPPRLGLRWPGISASMVNHAAERERALEMYRTWSRAPRQGKSMFIFKLAAGSLLNLLIFGLLLFVPAGTLGWWRAWVFIGVIQAGVARDGGFVFPKHPDLLDERWKPPIQKGQPLADRIVLLTFIAAYCGLTVFVPLDVFRFHWMGGPGAVISSVGLIFVIDGMALFFFCFRDNAFAAPVVRHQRERSHVVIDKGAYGMVRHPMYAGATLLMIGMALWLESYAGAVLALAPIALLAVRIGIEEKFLLENLKGYDAYRERVRYRLIPFVW